MMRAGLRTTVTWSIAVGPGRSAAIPLMVARPARPSQPRIDRLALQGEDGEDALVNPPQGVAGDEALQSLDAERELVQRQRPLRPQAARAEAGEVRLVRVVRAVDDPQVLAATDL